MTPRVVYQGGGALEKAEKIENFYGNAEFLSGRELQEKGMQQARQLESVSWKPRFWDWAVWILFR